MIKTSPAASIAATDTRTAIEELLEVVSSMLSVPKLYSDGRLEKLVSIHPLFREGVT
jgi:hypothetical protein